ncbi:MAG: hypothetical protein U5L01_00850 [Rheinheimera sp.]|nr:hypothetical protein [Rheinheimera sp.]
MNQSQRTEVLSILQLPELSIWIFRYVLWLMQEVDGADKTY